MEAFVLRDDGLERSRHRGKQLTFRPRIACRRDADHPPTLMTTETATHKVMRDYGRTTLCESYTGDTLVKPFFDFDAYTPDRQDPSRVFEDVCLQPLEQMLGVQRDRLAVASRSDWVVGREGRRWKTSLRIFVQGLCLRAHDMNRVLADRAFGDPGWDKSIYPAPGAERLLAVVGGIKGKDGDRRQLKPLEGQAPRPYAHFLIQWLYGGETPVEVPDDRPAQRARRVADEREAPASAEKNRMLPLGEDRMMEVATRAMEAAQMTGCRPMCVRGNSVYFVNDGQRRCVHRAFHQHNNCYVNFAADGDLVYHCCSGRCEDRPDPPIGSWEPDPRALDLSQLPAAALMEFSPAVVREVKLLADRWPDHKAAFTDVSLAYVNRWADDG